MGPWCRLRATWVGLLALLVVVAATPRAALAAGEDAAAQSAVQAVLNEEYASGSFTAAKQKVDAALAACAKKCAAPTRAQIFVVLGMIASQQGRKDDARAMFGKALAEDPNAQLPARTTPDIRSEWQQANESTPKAKTEAEAQAQAQAPAQPQAHAPSQDVAQAGEPMAPAPEPAPAPGTPAKIPGWNNADAFQEASAGLAADIAGKLDQCIEHDQASLKLEEQPRTRLHLASCEQRNGKLLDALRDSQKALEDGINKRDQAVMKAARERVTRILPLIPHVTFVPPPGVDDLTVTFDDRPVPADALTKKFSIDPGRHTVHAEGTQGGLPLSMDQEYQVRAGELLTVQIALRGQTSEYLTPGQLKCMLGAKSQDDVLKCLPQNRKNLVVNASMGIAGYADTNHVYVWSPEVTGGVSSPTAGWNVGGNFILDVVTAASPDIVSEASPAYHEKRYAGGLNGGYKPGKYGVSAYTNVSSEPDYLSLGGGAAVTADLKDKLVTPRLGAGYRHDTIGRGGTSFDVFSRHLDVTSLDASVTFVMTKTTLLLVGATLELERGDQSKPYRYVPMFDQKTVAPFIPAGATVDLVNRYRLQVRPLEQLPTERDRYALAARFAKRLGSTTLRIEERLYNDTWQTKASTTDARYVMDLSKHLRIWPHFRFHAQTATSFYQLAYSLVVQQDGSIVVPTYRSDDRELSPLITFTGGGGAHVALSSPESKNQYGISLQGDAMYTRFLNALFVTQRTAVYGTLVFDAEFE